MTDFMEVLSAANPIALLALGLFIGVCAGICICIPAMRSKYEKIAVLERQRNLHASESQRGWDLYKDIAVAKALLEQQLTATEDELAGARRQLSNAWGATGETMVSDHDLTLAQAIQKILVEHRQEVAHLKHQLNMAHHAAAAFEEEIDELHDKAVDRELAAFLQGADYAELEIAAQLEQAHIAGYEAALWKLFGEVYEDAQREAYLAMADTETAKGVVMTLFDQNISLERRLVEALGALQITAEHNYFLGYHAAEAHAADAQAELVDQAFDLLLENIVLTFAVNDLAETGSATILHWMGRWAKAYKDYRAEQKDHLQTQLLLDEARATANRAYARGVFTVLGALPIDPAVIASVALSLPSHLYDMMAVAEGFVPDYRPVAKAPTFTPNPADVQNAVLGLVIADYGSVAPHFLRLLHEADDANGFGGLLPGGD